MIRTSKHQDILWPAVIFGIAVALRFFHIFSIFNNSPFFDILPGDLGSYDRWAVKIINEGWIGKEIFYQDPLYPYFLALIYKTIGRDFLWIYCIHAVMGGMTSILIYLTGKNVFSRTVGIIGGFLYAFYAPAVYFDGLLLKVSLSALLFTSCIYFLLKDAYDRPRFTQLASGLSLGLAVLTRANFLLLIPVILLILAVTRQAVFKRRIIIMALFLIGNSLILFPALLRNYVIGNDWVLTTAQAGQNFYIGQNPASTGTYISFPFVRADPLYEREDFHREAESRLKKPLKPSEVSDYWFGEGIAFIKDNPFIFLRLTGKKFLMFINEYEVADNHNFYFHKRYSKTLRMLPLGFGMVGPFFLLGILTMLKERRAAVYILFLTQTAYIISVIVFYVFSRYRMPVMPLFCLTAAYAVCDLLNNIKDKRWAPVVLKAAAVFGAYLLVNHQVIKPFDFSHSFTDEAIAYEYKGDYGRAVQSYDDALKVNPGYLRALRRLGKLQVRLGLFQDAEKTYQKLLALQPGSGEALKQLMFIQRMKGHG
jgi:4-amino-4-deoxy-L-arabinose transferase-like glycosyltransferase